MLVFVMCQRKAVTTRSKPLAMKPHDHVDLGFFRRGVGDGMVNVAVVVDEVTGRQLGMLLPGGDDN